MSEATTYDELEQQVQNLRVLEKQYRSIVEDQTEFIVRWLPNGVRTFVNDSYCRYFGKSREELIGTSFFPLINSIDLKKVQARIRKLTPENPVSTDEHRVILPDGNLGWNQWTDRAIFDSKGLLIEYQSVGRDITELKNANLEKERLQLQLRETQKLESIGTLAGGIAHDFNNILFAIMGYTELALLNDIKNPQALQNDLNEILKGVYRAKELIQQILVFCRKSEQQLVPVKIQSVIKEALNLLRASIPTTIEIKEDINPDCQTVLANFTQVHQVIMNLCTNAYQAMKKSGGLLGVSLQPILLNDNDINGKLHLKPGAYVKLKVSDTGPGMTKDIIARIFEPYFTTKERGEGTGLGLSVVHGIITSLNGDIFVYSKPGKGTVFSIYLPTINFEDHITQTDKLTAALPTGDEHILFVDDDQTIVEMNKVLLKNLGYSVTGLTDSMQALTLFEQNPGRFDIIISDMTMPKLTGEKLAERIQAIQPKTPIILCSGYDELIGKDNIKNIPINRYIMKPINIQELATLIRSALDADL